MGSRGWDMIRSTMARIGLVVRCAFVDILTGAHLDSARVLNRGSSTAAVATVSVDETSDSGLKDFRLGDGLPFMQADTVELFPGGVLSM